MDVVGGTDIPFYPWLFGRLDFNNVQVEYKRVEARGDIDSPSSPSYTQPQLYNKELCQEIVNNSSNCTNYKWWIDSTLRLKVITGCVVEGE